MVQPLVNECPGRSMDQLGTPGRTCQPCWAAPGPFPVLGGKSRAPPSCPSPAPRSCPCTGTQIWRDPSPVSALASSPNVKDQFRTAPPPPPPKSIFPRCGLSSNHLPSTYNPMAVRRPVSGLLSYHPSLLSLPSELAHCGEDCSIANEGQLMGSGSEFPFQHSSDPQPLLEHSSVTGNLLRPWFCCRIP